MPIRIEKNPAYAKALSEDGRIDLTAIQFFTTPQWEEWIIDRLQGRDFLVPLDPRQGEDPEFLFLSLMLQLGKARDTAEYAIMNILNHAFQAQWEDKPLASLFYLIERLHVNNCIPALLRYLNAPFKMRPIPYGRALAALAQFDKVYPVAFEDWRKWVRRDEKYLLPQCFRRLINFNSDMAIRLLGVAEWANWKKSPLAQALLNELDMYFFSTSPNESAIAGLWHLANARNEFREAMFSILPDIGGTNGWSRKLFNTYHPSAFKDGNVRDEKNHPFTKTILKMGVAK